MNATIIPPMCIRQEAQNRRSWSIQWNIGPINVSTSFIGVGPTSIASTNSSTHFYMQLKRGRNELHNQLTQSNKTRHDTKITTSYDRFSRGGNLYIRLVKRNAILLIPTPGVLITRGKLGRHTWKILLIYHQSDNMKYGNVLHQDRNQTVPITQQLTDPKRRLHE